MTKFVSVPREMGHLNPAAFVAGIVRGVLDGGGFPARCAVGRARWPACKRALECVGGRRRPPVLIAGPPSGCQPSWPRLVPPFLHSAA